MKLKALASVLAIGLFASSNASAIVVGGVDFGVQGLTSHLETATFANTWLTPDAPAGSMTYGYGLVTTVNGSTDYCPSGACALYFTYEAELESVQPGGFPLGSSVLVLKNSKYDFFLDLGSPSRNLLNFSSLDNLDFITALDPWLSLVGHAPGYAGAGTSDYFVSGTYSGGTGFAGTGAGLADVVLGVGAPGVAEFLDTNGEADTVGGFADIKITSSVDSSVLNVNDECTFQNGQWCMQGTANVRGTTNVVPEPGVLALLGLGILGLGLSRRRKAA